MTMRFQPTVLFCSMAMAALAFCSPMAIGQSPSTRPTTEPFAADVMVNGHVVHIEINSQVLSITRLPSPPTNPPGSDSRGEFRMWLGQDEVPTREQLKASDLGKPIANPLAKLLPEGVALFKKRNVDIEPMQKMKAVLIVGDFMGANARDIVNDDPNLVIILGRKFGTHGSVQSAGPIIIESEDGVMGTVKSSSIVWYVDGATPRDDVSGQLVICSPDSGLNQAKFTSPEVWLGKYGWPEEGEKP